MSRLRVALDVTPLLGPPTGVHQVTRGLLDALIDGGEVDVTGWLLTARGEQPLLGVPVRHSRVPARLALAGWGRSGFPPGPVVTGPADVIHGTNFVAPPNPASVISLQDMTPLTHPEWCRPEVAAMAPTIRNAARRGATFHVSSALVRDEAIAELAVPRERVRLVHHALVPIGGDPGTGRGIAGSDRYALVLGTVERRKRVTMAVEAMHGIDPDVRLVIVGPDGNDEDELAAATRALGDDRVRRLPAVDAHSRNALVRGADALLWPSQYEGFALPPLEALSVGTPVVATAVGALPELIGDEVGLIAPDDCEGFAAAVGSALTDPPPVPESLTQRLESLTWAKACEKMLVVYRDVASA